MNIDYTKQPRCALRSTYVTRNGIALTLAVADDDVTNGRRAEQALMSAFAISRTSSSTPSSLSTAKVMSELSVKSIADAIGARDASEVEAMLTKVSIEVVVRVHIVNI